MKILIADDSEPIVASLKKLISTGKKKVIVSAAYTINDAIVELRDNTPDLLILDIMFPEGNGLELLYEARNFPQVKTIIILTNFPYERLKSKSFAMGADYFFDKSNEFERVIEVINGFIQN